MAEVLVVEVGLGVVLVRCIKPPVQIAGKSVKCHSSPAGTARSTAGTVFQSAREARVNPELIGPDNGPQVSEG